MSVVLVLYCIVDRPEMRDLYNIKVVQELSAACNKAKNVWRHVGYELGLRQDQLDIIETDNETRVECRCAAMLAQWLRCRLDATWERLKEALEAAELYQLASIVSDCLLPTETSSCTDNTNKGTLNFNWRGSYVAILLCLCGCGYVCVSLCVCFC